MYSAQESSALGLALAGSFPGNFLSAKESYGWFDDIPEEGWPFMKLSSYSLFST
jgi:hypothetical protein